MDFEINAFLFPVTYKCALGYNGTIARTSTGRLCRRWDVSGFHIVAGLPDNSISDAANYCRNPDAKASGPWCYIVNNLGAVSWESCGIDPCLSKSGSGHKFK